DIPADHVRLPLDGEDVEIVREGAAWQGVGRTDAVRAGVAGAMHRPVDRRRLAANVFHDVDLSAVRPVRRIDIIPQHPKCRPEPLPVGNLDARLEPAIRLLELALGLDARGGVLALPVPAALSPGERLLD